MVRRRTLARLAAAIVSALLLEVLLRVADPFGISYFPETARYLDTLEPHDALGYRNRPNLRGEFYGTTIEINSMGLRDGEIPEAKDENEFRIYVLGDSLPFGVGVEREESFVCQLERRFNDEPGRNGRVRTINGGTISYNTQQELAQLRALAGRVKPDLLVLIFSDNDLEPPLWVFERRRRWYVRLLEPSYTASFALVVARVARGALDAVRPRRPGGGGSANRPEEGFRGDSPGWPATAGALREIHAISRRLDVPFVLFTAVPRDSRAESLLRGVADGAGFPMFSMAPGEGDPRRVDPARYRNSFVDAHPNAAGNGLDAENIYRSLRSAGAGDWIEKRTGGRAGSAGRQADPGPDALGKNADSTRRRLRRLRGPRRAPPRGCAPHPRAA
jgi:hypothetical protein